MPIYEYRCAACSQVFEALQRVNDEPLDQCRYCSGPARRIISSPAIHFVGSGWYVTDYARKGQARKDGAEAAARKAAARSGKAAANSDGKTASGGAREPAAASSGAPS